MLKQISENEINIRKNKKSSRRNKSIKVKSNIIEKIYTSKTAATQTEKDRDDRMCELMEHAFFLELTNRKYKKALSTQQRNTVKLRSELVKLRTKDAIMRSKMNETNRRLMEQTSQYNDLQSQIQQVVSLAAIGGMNGFSSPTRSNRVSFSSSTLPKTPKMPVCGIEDDGMSPIAEDEEYPIDKNVNKSTTSPDLAADAELSTSHSSSVSSAAIDIPSKFKGPVTPAQDLASSTVKTAFSYIDAMRFLMSPPPESYAGRQAMDDRFGSMYGTTPLTNEQLNFQAIVGNAETEAMKQKIAVVKNMYQKENDGLKERIAQLEKQVKDKEEQCDKYKHDLAKAHLFIEEQNKVLKSTKNVMTAFEMHEGSSGKSSNGKRRVSKTKLIQASFKKEHKQQKMLFESSGGGRRGYYGKLGVF